MADASAKPWVFSQLSHKPKRDDITLLGWNAPFGRPRQGAIVNAGVQIRRSITYYTDGDSGPTAPTVHAFGTEPKSFELHGRWMDRVAGAERFVRKKRREWVDFVQDKDLVSARWGDILSYVIFIHDIDLHFESEFEIVWKLTADVIRDDQSPVIIAPLPVTTPIDFATQIAEASQAVLHSPVPPNIRSLLGELSDQIDDVISAMQEPFAAIYDTALAIADFENALSTDLVKMASGLQTVKTSILALRDMTELAISRFQLVNDQTEALLISAESPNFLHGLLSGPDQIELATNKLANDRDMLNLLALIADMQTSIAQAQRGQVSTAIAAQDGDTWESIATRSFGGPGAARSIKDMNGVRYGQRPQPGKTYHIPKTP